MTNTLLQPIYNILQWIFPDYFWTSAFFSFLINLVFFGFSLLIFYIIFIYPLRVIIHSFNKKKGANL